MQTFFLGHYKKNYFLVCIPRFTNRSSKPQGDKWEHGHHSRCSGCISSACDFDLAGCLLHQYPSHNCSTVLPHAGEERQTSAHDRAFRLLLNITIVKNVIVCFMQRHTPNYWPSTKFRNQGCHSSYAEVEFGVHEKEGFIEAEQCC